jgi:hypothetical protein
MEATLFLLLRHLLQTGKGNKKIQQNYPRNAALRRWEAALFPLLNYLCHHNEKTSIEGGVIAICLSICCIFLPHVNVSVCVCFPSQDPCSLSTPQFACFARTPCARHSYSHCNCHNPPAVAPFTRAVFTLPTKTCSSARGGGPYPLPEHSPCNP